MTAAPVLEPTIATVAHALYERLDRLPPPAGRRRTFLAAYARTTEAVGRAATAGAFADPAWVRRWDVAFADLFLAAHDADLAGGWVPRPWRLAFGADPGLAAVNRLLVELNAHLNWDLPLALLAVLDEEDLADPERLAARRRDHARIDEILRSRLTAEGRDLFPGLRGRALVPLNAWFTGRFLPNARAQAWHNAVELARARRGGTTAYRHRVAELDTLASTKVVELLAPRWVLPRLALTGYGVELPPA